MKIVHILLLMSIVLLMPVKMYAWPSGSCIVEITGSKPVCVGETINLQASCSEPTGGTCSWSNTPGLTPSGCTATFTGPFDGVFWVSVWYTGSGFKCNDVDRIPVGAKDADGDGHYSKDSCKLPNDDCDDSNPKTYPGAPEICDGNDNNCDGQVDESTDADGDGHYPIGACKIPNDDCDDSDPDVYPGAPEKCDGKDNDCNGKVDDFCPGLSVSLEKQCNTLWKYDTYDHKTVTIIKDAKGNPTSCTGCICSDGCALTSAVMVLRYYGVTTGADGKEVNPGNLNEWLKNEPKGYDRQHSINWWAVTKYSGNKVIFNGQLSRNDKVLNDDLCNGKPVILNVPSHFVVATGVMCAGNETTWSINDPGYNITTLQGYGNTYLGLRRFKQ